MVRFHAVRLPTPISISISRRLVRRDRADRATHITPRTGNNRIVGACRALADRHRRRGRHIGGGRTPCPVVAAEQEWGGASRKSGRQRPVPVPHLFENLIVQPVRGRGEPTRSAPIFCSDPGLPRDTRDHPGKRNFETVMINVRTRRRTGSVTRARLFNLPVGVTHDDPRQVTDRRIRRQPAGSRSNRDSRHRRPIAGDPPPTEPSSGTPR
jgi:hypothetical protein